MVSVSMFHATDFLEASVFGKPFVNDGCGANAIECLHVGIIFTVEYMQVGGI